MSEITHLSKNQKKRLKLKAKKSAARSPELELKQKSVAEKEDLKQESVKDGTQVKSKSTEPKQSSVNSKKNPSKLVARIKQQIAKRQEEELKAKQEAEEAAREKREAEILRQETERAKSTRVEERRKRRAELKKAGVLLTPSQKEKQARNQNFVAQLHKVQGRLTSLSVIQKQPEATQAETTPSSFETDKPTALRTPICILMGHVDCGKTSITSAILDVKFQEAGLITQEIRAFSISKSVLDRHGVIVAETSQPSVQGFMLLDSPGHEAFIHLREQANSFCDVAILVISLLDGLQDQTLECIKLLGLTQTPFIIALTKIDRLYGWDTQHPYTRQSPHVLTQFHRHVHLIIKSLATHGIVAGLYDDDTVDSQMVAMIPLSSITKQGINNLLDQLLLYANTRLASKLVRSAEVFCKVLDVCKKQGWSTTLQILLINGSLHKGDHFLIATRDGVKKATIRFLLVTRHNQVITKEEAHAPCLLSLVPTSSVEGALSGCSLYIVNSAEEEEKKGNALLQSQRNLDLFLKPDGVHIQANTCGALESLLILLQEEDIPVASMGLGEIQKRDFLQASLMLSKTPKYAIMVVFNVDVSSVILKQAEESKLALFQGKVMFPLVRQVKQHLTATFETAKKTAHQHVVFPVELLVLPKIFRKSNPCIFGVRILEGKIALKTPLCVVKEGKCIALGRVEGLQRNGEDITMGTSGMEVCIKLDQKEDACVGKQFTENDYLYSHLNRKAIDLLKEFYKDEVSDAEWRLVIRLKKLLDII